MKKVVSLLLLVGVVLVAYGCRKDYILPAQESLTGDYRGLYIYKFEGQTETTQPITWVFGTNRYEMRFDTVNGDTRYFCDNIGEFEREGSRLTFTTAIENLNQDLCSPDQNPEGVFQLIGAVNEGDSIQMIQIIDDLTTTIKIIPDI